jgi:hypothetical protein
MNDQAQLELLVRIDQRAATLHEAWKQASSTEGFPRCAAREVLIADLAERLRKIEGGNTWLWRAVALSILGVISGLLFGK